ncbi:MAG: hypothetical protein ACI3T9_00950 [Romboutsia timonensis]
MAKQIVGKFNKDFSKIEFYEIMDNYKEYTIIRKQGTTDYYAWDNKASFLSDNLHIISIPDNKVLYDKIIEHVRTWYVGAVFFWADSKFVTEYGLPNYDKLVNIYKELINIKATELEILNTVLECKENESFLTYIRTKMLAYKFLRRQRKTVKELEKEFKIIW